MITKEITTDEWFLIEALRNYRKAYPNGARMLENEINEILDKLMDLEYKEESEEQNEEQD